MMLIDLLVGGRRSVTAAADSHSYVFSEYDAHTYVRSQGTPFSNQVWNLADRLFDYCSVKYLSEQENVSQF